MSVQIITQYSGPGYVPSEVWTTSSHWNWAELSWDRLWHLPSNPRHWMKTWWAHMAIPGFDPHDILQVTPKQFLVALQSLEPTENSWRESNEPSSKHVDWVFDYYSVVEPPKGLKGDAMEARDQLVKDLMVCLSSELQLYADKQLCTCRVMIQSNWNWWWQT